MCYLISHDKIQPAYADDERSIGYKLIPKNWTTEVIEALGATLNFIYIWIKKFEENSDARFVSYSTAMEFMIKQITLTMIKSLTPEQKFQKLMTEIGGGWSMVKCAKGLPPLNISTLSKKAPDEKDKKKLYETNKWWNCWKIKLHWNKL